MRFESATSTLEASPVDVYLGFEIFEKDGIGFAAIPRGWARDGRTVLKASDLPTLRKRIWFWWYHLAG